MKDREVIEMIERAYRASYELCHSGTTYYWASAFVGPGREIAGTRASTLKEAAEIAGRVLGSSWEFVA
jgi:hypothetical protein